MRVGTAELSAERGVVARQNVRGAEILAATAAAVVDQLVHSTAFRRGLETESGIESQVESETETEAETETEKEKERTAPVVVVVAVAAPAARGKAATTSQTTVSPSWDSRGSRAGGWREYDQ